MIGKSQTPLLPPSRLILSLLLLLTALPSVGKVSVGAKGGVQLTEMSFTADALRKSNRAGFFIGPTVRLTTPVTGLGIDLSALYDNRSLNIAGEKFTQQSLLVPANARLGATMLGSVGVFLQAGPQLSFNIGKDMKHWQESDGTDREYFLQTTQLSLNFGAGVRIGALEGTLSYNVPIGKTGDFTWRDLQQQLQQQTWQRAKTTTNAWRIAITYYF